MKKALLLSLVVLAALIVSIPALAWWEVGTDVISGIGQFDGTFDNINVGLAYVRQNEVDDRAFEHAKGLFVVQMATGNANAVGAATNLAVNASNSDLLASGSGAVGIAADNLALEGLYYRFDKVTDHAFQNAKGIFTVQMASGNANVVQSAINVTVGF